MMNHGITFDNELLFFLKTGKRMRLFTPDEAALAGGGAPAFNGVPILPSDTTTYPLVKYISGSAVFAAQDEDGTNGYYNPQTGAFAAEAGMSGDKIERVEYVTFNGSQLVETDVTPDRDTDTTITLRRQIGSSGDRIPFGSLANGYTAYYLQFANETLYVNIEKQYSASAAPTAGEWHECRMWYDERIRYSLDGEEQALSSKTCNTFIGLEKLRIGGYGSRASFIGDVSDVTIILPLVRGGAVTHLIPIKCGSTYALFDQVRWRLCATVGGTLAGGEATGEDIAFPSDWQPVNYSVAYTSNSKYQLKRTVDDIDEYVAISSNGDGGYYAPSIGRFTAVSDMLAEKMEQVEYTSFNATQGIRLLNNDSLIYVNALTDEIRIRLRRTADTEDSKKYVFGGKSQDGRYYLAFNSENHPCIRTMNYDYGASDVVFDDITVLAGEWHTFRMYVDTETHFVFDDIEKTSPKVSSTQSTGYFALGGFYGNAFDPYLNADVSDFEVIRNGEEFYKLIPVKRGKLYDFLDALSWRKASIERGSFTVGGPVIGDIPWPEEAAEA